MRTTKLNEHNSVFSGHELELAINFALRAIQLDRSPNSHIYWPKDKEKI